MRIGPAFGQPSTRDAAADVPVAAGEPADVAIEDYQPRVTMTRLKNHPAQLLRAELDARRMSANQLALALRVPASRVTAILREERAVTAETAVRLGRYLGTEAALWMNLQTAYDVSVVEATQGALVSREVLPA